MLGKGNPGGDWSVVGGWPQYRLTWPAPISTMTGFLTLAAKSEVM